MSLRELYCYPIGTTLQPYGTARDAVNVDSHSDVGLFYPYGKASFFHL